MGEGLFSNENIKKGTILMEFNDSKVTKMNDPLFKYSNILNSDTPEKLTKELFDASDSYYDILKAYEKINVCLATNNNGIKFYVANKDIAIGDQLFRVYGFEAWLFELWNCLTIDNVEGYYDFLTYILEEEQVNTYNEEYDIDKEMELFRKSTYLYKIFTMNSILCVLLQKKTSNKISETLHTILMEIGICESSDTFGQKLEKIFEIVYKRKTFALKFCVNFKTDLKPETPKEETTYHLVMFFALFVFYMAYNFIFHFSSK
jgi:lysyl-tRNA synthetase class II